MTVQERLAEVELWVSEGFPINRAMKALEVSRSMYYYEQNKEKTSTDVKRGRPFPGYSLTNTGEKIPDEQIEEFLMEAIEGEEGIYGYKKLTHYLQKQHNLVIDKKKVYRLCAKLDILLPKRIAQSKFPRRMAKQHMITQPNQLWQLDIKYGSIEKSGRFFFLASAIDVFDRSIVGYYRGSKCQAKDITNMLKEALKTRQVYKSNEKDEYSIIIRTDNGPQFVSHHFGEFCAENKIYHERIPPKSPNLNAFIESFHSVIERECYRRYTFECFEEAYFRIDEFMEFYNLRRFHGSLNYRAPLEFHDLYKELGNTEEMAISL